MDGYLLAWARRVKARRGGRATAPALWLFTDDTRLPDPLPAIGRLPTGLSGVVFRHDDWPDRSALARKVARLCRARGIVLSVAGDWRLAAAVGAGVHLRGGRLPSGLPRSLPRSTASAHGVAEAVRARRAGAALVFLSPVFATASHAGARPLRATGWNRLARGAGPGAAALGGVSGVRVRSLPATCAAVGAITAMQLS